MIQAIKRGNVRLLAILTFPILILIFWFTISITPVYANENNLPLISVESKTIHRGQTFDVDVNLSKNTGLISLLLKIDYDETVMTLTDVIRKDALSSLKYTTTNVDTELGYKVKPFTILFDGKDIDSSNGLLLTLVFDSNIEANTGLYPITLSYDKDNTNSDYKTPIDIDITNGSVELISGEFEAVYRDYDGKVLYQKDYNGNEIPSYPNTMDLPTREEDNEYTYEFIGWKGAISNDINVLLYVADYKKTPKVYTVFFYIDGYKGKPDGIIDESDYYKSIELAYGEIIDIEAPNKEYYKFFGWFMDNNFSNYASSIMPSHDTRLYGYYEFEIKETNIPTISLNSEYIDDTQEEVLITASIIYNPGFNAMVLTLKYDKDVFIFTRFEDLDALQSMQSDKTNPNDLSNDNFKFYYEDVANNYETGAFLKMYFKIKPDAKKGEYEIGFTYNQYQDATYFDKSLDLKYTKININNANVLVGVINHWNEELDNGRYFDITSSDGKPVNVYVNINSVLNNINLTEEEISKAGKNMKASSAYQIKMMQNGIEINPDTNLTIKIKLTSDEINSQIGFYKLNQNNELEEIEYSIEDGFIIFSTNNLSDSFVIFTNSKINKRKRFTLFNIGLPIALSISTLFYAFILRRKSKNKKKEDE